MLRLKPDRAHKPRAVDDGVGRPERDIPRARALAARVDRERIVDARLVGRLLHAVPAAVRVVDAEESEALRAEVADHLDVLRDRLHARAAPGGPEVDDDDAALERGPDVALARVQRVRLARASAVPLGDGDGRRRLPHHRAMRARITRTPEPPVGEFVRCDARLRGARRGRSGGCVRGGACCGGDGRGEERADRRPTAEFTKHGERVPHRCVETGRWPALYARFSAESGCPA